MKETFYNQQEMQECIAERGFLPFFSNQIQGFSIEEMCPEELWYSDTGFEDGQLKWSAWEWKGPLIVEGDLAYGKFFRGKAGFITMDWFPHYVNYRRAAGNLSEDEMQILSVIKEHKSLLSKEIKRLCGYVKPRQPHVNPMEKMMREETKKAVKKSKSNREAYETAITKLQMLGHVVTADFEYSYDKNGKRYGWGIARYCTPEDFFGAERLCVDCSPAESYNKMVQHLCSVLPSVPQKSIERLLKMK